MTALLRTLHRWASGPVLRYPLVAAGLAGPRTPHSDAECDCLARWASGRRRLVELGVHEGACTTLLRRAMSPDGTLYAVDPFPRGRFGVSFPQSIAHSAVRRVRNGRVRWLRMLDVEAADVIAEEHPEGVDLVFSDCGFDWDSLAHEWRAWRELIVPGGIFVQSTSRPMGDRPGPEHDTVRYTRDVLESDPLFELVDTADAFTVLRRRA